MLANMALPVLADGPVKIFLPMVVKEDDGGNANNDASTNPADNQPLAATSLVCPLEPAAADFQTLASNAGHTPGQFEVSETGRPSTGST